MTFDRTDWTPYEWAVACSSSLDASRSRRARARRHYIATTALWAAVATLLAVVLYVVVV